MYAQFQKPFGYPRACAQGAVRLYEGFCSRWAERAENAGDHARTCRQIGAICLMPLPVLAAFLSAGRIGNVAELAILGVCLIGLTITLCALSSLKLGRTLVGITALTTYAIALAVAGIGAQTGHPVLWLMAAALPVEAWLITQTSKGFGVGVMAAIPVAMALMFFASPLAAPISAPIVVSFLVIYAGALLLRVMRSPVRMTTDTAAPAQDEVLESALGAMVLQLNCDGVITSVSTQSAEQLGVAAEVLLHSSLIERIHVADRIQYLSLLADLRRSAINNGDVVQPEPRNLRMRVVRLTPGLAPKVIYQTYAFAGASQAGRITLVARDNEAALAQETELVAARAALHEMTVSRDRGLAAVSHELRTPLNSIIGFSDLLLHELGCRFENEKQREYVGLIQRSGTYLLDVVNSVLDTAKIDSGSYYIAPESFVFHDAVSMCTSMLAQQADQKGIILCDRVSGSIGNLIGDQRAVQQILINLVTNAIKFTERGGCVTVDARRAHKDSVAVLEFSVSDNGIGIAPADLQRIGQPFVQIDTIETRIQEGTGLGLSLVKGLVELHDGTLKISSSPGVGTVVTVTLPLEGPSRAQAIVETEEEAGTVIDLLRLQMERRNDKHEDETEEQGHAQTRKTA